MKYRKKPIVIEASRWFKMGDHPGVVSYEELFTINPESKCKICGKPLMDHGWVDTLEGTMQVCPGDWIIRGVQGELYPCKPTVFEKTYEPVNQLDIVKDEDC